MRSRWRLARAGVAMAAAVGTTMAAGCGDREVAPNVILVVFDTTRFDDWSWLDPSRGVTPTLDSLAADGCRFTNAYSLHPMTVPSHTVLFTGQELPPRETSSYDYRERSLFTILRDRGWRTYAFSGNSNLHRSRLEALLAVDATAEDLHTRMPADRIDGILRKYGAYPDDVGALNGVGRREYVRIRRIVGANADMVNEATIAAMRNHTEHHGDEPFFLFLNYNDAHDPYFPEGPWDELHRSSPATQFRGDIRAASARQAPPDLSPFRLSQTAEGLAAGDVIRARDLHLGEVAFASDRFGKLLEELRSLGLLERSVIVCTSDHGELFGEDGRMSHGGESHEALLHVPLVMRFPGAEASSFEARVDLRDVKPTLLDYLGIEDETSTGRSLLPLIRGETADLPPPAPWAPTSPDLDEQVLPGQNPSQTEKLIEELRTLGYID